MYMYMYKAFGGGEIVLTYDVVVMTFTDIQCYGDQIWWLGWKVKHIIMWVGVVYGVVDKTASETAAKKTVVEQLLSQ